MPGRYRNLGEVSDAVDQSYGLLNVSMEDLRDAVGARALGRKVRKQIADGLISQGIEYYPSRHDRELGDLPPRYHWEWVRLYNSDSPAANLIDAALDPSSENDSQLLQALAWLKVLEDEKNY